MTVSEFRLRKLLPYILFEKKLYIYISGIGDGPAQRTGTVPVVSAHFRSACDRRQPTSRGCTLTVSGHVDLLPVRAELSGESCRSREYRGAHCVTRDVILRPA